MLKPNQFIYEREGKFSHVSYFHHRPTSFILHNNSAWVGYSGDLQLVNRNNVGRQRATIGMPTKCLWECLLRTMYLFSFKDMHLVFDVYILDSLSLENLCLVVWSAATAWQLVVDQPLG